MTIPENSYLREEIFENKAKDKESTEQTQAAIQTSVLTDPKDGVNVLPRQVMQLVTSIQPQQQLQQTAQEQISSGYLDIKV